VVNIAAWFEIAEPLHESHVDLDRLPGKLLSGDVK